MSQDTYEIKRNPDGSYATIVGGAVVRDKLSLVEAVEIVEADRGAKDSGNG